MSIKQELAEKYAELYLIKKNIDAEVTKQKGDLMDAFEGSGDYAPVTTEFGTVSYKAESWSEGITVKQVKDEYPEVFDSLKAPKKTSATITFKK